MRAARRHNLRRLLRPRSVAFVGGKACAPAIAMARAAGFQGDIWPVHPTYKTLAGQRVFATVDALPSPPDAAFLNISKQHVFGVVEQLSECGAGGAVCFAAGFAELGTDGREQQAELATRAGPLALVGPNSTGLLNYFAAVALWPVADHEAYRLRDGVAILSSSGGVLFNYTVNQRSLQAGIMIGVGNQAVLDYADYLHVLAHDEQVRAVGLVVEDLGDTVAFSHAAAEALALDKPVVVLKSGVSAIGAQVAQTHSGALVARDDMVQATLDRVGAVRVRSLPELDETLKMLTTTRRPKGRRVAVLTNSGGEKALAADAAEGTVIEFTAPSPATTADLARQIPEFAVVSNPFDYNAYFAGAGPDVLGEDAPDRLTKCFRTMAADDYDVAIMLCGFRTGPDGVVEEPGTRIQTWVDAVRDLDIACVMASVLPEHMPSVIGKQLIECGVAPLQGIHEVMQAVHHAIVWQQRRPSLLMQPVDDIGLQTLPQLTTQRVFETESTAKQMLASCGLRTPKGQVCTPREAAAAASKIGYPVAVKIHEPVVAHKAHAGGVILRVADEAQLGGAISTMQSALSDNGLTMQSLLVEEMIAHTGIELMVGVTFDSRFGHALLFGRGGSMVELVNDVAMTLLPASADALSSLVKTTDVGKQLTSSELDAVTDALAAVAMLVESRRDEMSSLDINPLIVTPGGEIVALDALLERAT